VRLKLDAKVLADTIAGRRAILPSLPNMQDNLAVQTLSTSKIGDLPVDQFGRLVSRDGTSPRESNGPPYIKLGKSVRYSKSALLAWLKSHQH
jgi:hypothetical protein